VLTRADANISVGNANARPGDEEAPRAEARLNGLEHPADHPGARRPRMDGLRHGYSRRAGCLHRRPASQFTHRVVTPGHAIGLDETDLVWRITAAPIRLPRVGLLASPPERTVDTQQAETSAQVAAVARLAETDRPVHRLSDLCEVAGVVGARHRAYILTILGEALGGPGSCPARRQLTAAPDGAADAHPRTG
jgi:hypothetical protein